MMVIVLNENVVKGVIIVRIAINFIDKLNQLVFLLMSKVREV